MPEPGRNRQREAAVGFSSCQTGNYSGQQTKQKVNFHLHGVGRHIKTLSFIFSLDFMEVLWFELRAETMLDSS